MTTLAKYFQKWKFKLSTVKIVSAFFHLDNREANCELNVSIESGTIPTCTEQTCLGMKLYRALAFQRYLDSLRRLKTNIMC